MAKMRAWHYGLPMTIGFSMAIGAAYGQTAITGGTGDKTPQIETITVTAEKRTANVLKTPIPISVVTGTTMLREGKHRMDEVLQDVPGVAVYDDGGGALRFLIRGLTNSTDPNSDSANPTSTYFDGVYFDLSTQQRVGLYDVDHVEVLKGPQGTLYGANALGGAIDTITNDPVLNKLTASATIEAGNYDLISSQAALNLPVNPAIAIRVAAFSENRSGYLSDGLNDSDIHSGRIKVLYKPDDRLRIMLATEFSHVGGLGQGSGTWDPANGALADQSNPWESSSLVGSSNLNVFRSWGNLSYDLGDATVTYIPAYTLEKNMLGLAFPGGLVGHYYQHEPLFQHEVRLASPNGFPVQWTAGGYYLTLNKPVSFLFPDSTGSVTSLDKDVTEAVFGQVTYPVIDRFRLIAGLRYNEDRERESSSSVTTDANFNITSVLGAAKGYAKFYHFTWKGGFEADVSHSMMLYGTVSSGFRSGGFLPTTSSSAIQAFGPESLIAYELGLKGRMLDGRMTFAGDLFRYKYNDYQLSYNYPTGCSEQYCYTAIYNAPDSVSEGLEVSTNYLPTFNDKLGFGGTYLYTDIGQLTQASQIPYSNNRFDHAPRWALNGSYSHILDLGDSGSVTGEVDERFETKSLLLYNYEQPGYLPGALQPAFHQTSLNVLYEPMMANWSISAYVKNLENYPVKSTFQPGGSDNGYVNSTTIEAPRTYGIVFTLKLGH